MKKNYYIYLVTNFTNTVIYIGITNNLLRRIYEHKEGFVDSFTKKYKVTKLVYFEEYSDIHETLRREKQLKNWHREWKLNLVKENNPNFNEIIL